MQPRADLPSRVFHPPRTCSRVLISPKAAVSAVPRPLPLPGSIGRGSPARLLQISCSPRFTLHWDPIHLLLTSPVILMTVKPEAAKSLDQLNVHFDC